MIPLRLIFWVTSFCNHDCPYCNQSEVRDKNIGYEMSLNELNNFIISSQTREFHYKVIELTGGEPSLWSHFEEGLRLLSESKIADSITFITNGNNAQKVSEIAKLYAPEYYVSIQQATPKQVAIHRESGNTVLWNTNPHKPVPKEPVINSLPAQCAVGQSFRGERQNGLLYLKGMIYYCCNAPANMEIVGQDQSCSISFDEDFVSYFSNKLFDKEICSVCLCNHWVWSTVK